MDMKWKNLKNWVDKNNSDKWLTFGRLKDKMQSIEGVKK